MNRIMVISLLSVAAQSGLSGCGLIDGAQSYSDKQAIRAIGPEPLDGKYYIPAAPATSGGSAPQTSPPPTNTTANNGSQNAAAPTSSAPSVLAGLDVLISQDSAAKAAWLAQAVLDSRDKCDKFTARLTATKNSVDLGLDILTLGLAGASPITVPSRSANTLAALAGISAGTRAAIDSDIYQQNTAPIIVEKIDQTYGAALKAYVVPSSNGDINVAAEYAKIRMIHSQCSVIMALANVSNSTTASAPLTSKDIVDKGVYAAGNSVITLAANTKDKNGYDAIIVNNGISSTISDATVDNLVTFLNAMSAVKKN
jgi:hypothetical protein